MRFFTTLHPAGRLEYLFVSIVLLIANYANIVFVLELGVVGGLSNIDPNTVGSDEISYNSGAIGLAVVIGAVLLFLSFVNMGRRLKDLHMSFAWALLTFVPVIGLIFGIYLLFASGIERTTYTPYGDNPYDPNSWVPPEAPSASGTAVSYQGQDLYLPGEENWTENDQAA